MGDPEFFRVSVAPLLKKLDDHAARVSQDMTSADVETLFGEAVPGWMEIEFTVAAMRTKYLQDKRFAKP